MRRKILNMHLCSDFAAKCLYMKETKEIVANSALQESTERWPYGTLRCVTLVFTPHKAVCESCSTWRRVWSSCLCKVKSKRLCLRSEIVVWCQGGRGILSFSISPDRPTPITDFKKNIYIFCKRWWISLKANVIHSFVMLYKQQFKNA